MRRTVLSLLLACACATACLSASAEQAPASTPTTQDTSSTKLKEYQVGGSKDVPKTDSAVAPIERPKMDSMGAFTMDKPVIDVTPLTVRPVTSAPGSAAKPAAAAPAATAPAPRPIAPTTARTTPAPARAAPPTAVAPAPEPQTGAGAFALRPISTPPPDYPREAALAGTQGYVVIEFTLDTTGAPADVKVVDSNPPRVFDQAARRAVMRWKFEPYLVNGVATEKRVQRRIDFKL